MHDDHSPDEYQQAWQADTPQTRVMVDADLLQQQLQRNQHSFFTQILRRDVIEIGFGLVMIVYWLYQGFTSSLPWTWYLTVPAIVWIIGFFLVDRIRYPQQPSKPGDSLLSCVKNSLSQVEHQIWLLRNIFWWYLLPPTLSLLAFFSHVAWLASEDWLDAFSHAGNFALLFVVYGFVYWMNQRAVDSDLEPRRQELLVLLDSLDPERSAADDSLVKPLKSIDSAKNLRRWTFATVACCVALVVAAWASGIFDARYEGVPRNEGRQGEFLAKLVAEQRKEKKLVGLGAMVVVGGKVESVAADGERKRGSNVPIELGDRWHLGGITKSITATMIARLVEADRMQWSDTVGEVFSEAALHEDWKAVTVRQLLTHTAGARPNFPFQVRKQQPAFGVESTAARREAVLEIMGDPPTHVPGQRYAYSNVGLSIAGAMAEEVTGDTWEELLRREVFEPLELSEAGFGPPKSPDPSATQRGLDQPRGHREFLQGKVAVSDTADNTPIMGPSGAVHMTLRELCLYAEEHLSGELGGGKLLSAETYQLLHRPEIDNYACGWVMKEPTYEIPHTVYWHNGSNTMWYSLVVFVPDKKLVVAVTANDGDFRHAEAAAWEIVRSSLRELENELDIEGRKRLPSSRYPKRSPFSAVRWRSANGELPQPEVRVDGEWFRLLSIEDFPIDEILNFSRERYAKRWQKRFEEDLVELIARMGYSLGETAKLTLERLATEETVVMESVPLTTANRRAIRNEALARQREKQ